MYASVAEEGSDSVSVATSKRKFGRKRINSELSEPLTSAGTSIVDEELGSNGGDPYFVFRKDLQRKLELVDESLADFLRIVHETVGFVDSSFGFCVVLQLIAVVSFVVGHGGEYSRIQRCKEAIKTPLKKCGIDPERCSHDSSGGGKR
jgi:hypothetical protein